MLTTLRHALRALARTPALTAVAVLSLALGVGANAAIFSLFDQLLRRPLPARAPDELVNLAAPGPKDGAISCGRAGDCDAIFSYPMFRDLARAQTVLTGLAGHRDFGANLAFRGQTLTGDGVLVSGSYFPTLGLAPALGRLLGPADDQTVGGHPVVVLSHAYWQSQLGGDPRVVNQTLVVNGQPMTVVGVAPAGFEGTTVGVRPQVFVPLTMRGRVSPWFKGFGDRHNYWLYAFGRLKPGVTVEQARRALNAAYHPIVTDVEAPLQNNMSPTTLARFRAKALTLEPGPRGQSAIHRDAGTPVALLFGTTGTVLLIACANIANLLLARGAARAGEMAVRLSLGASRRQLVAQLLAESSALAALGGVTSVFVAWGTLRAFRALLPAEVAAVLPIRLDVPAVLFALGLALGTGLLFGLYPALHGTRPDVVSTVRANAGQIAGARSAARVRTALVTAQVALSLALLVPAGLFVRSLANVGRVALGLRPEHVVTFGVSPALNGYPPARARVLFAQIEQRLAATPGVTAVAASGVAILTGDNTANDVSVQGVPRDPDADLNAKYNEVSAGYFRALGIPLRAGREFTPADRAGGPKVAVVNEAFLRKFRLGRDAVGRYMAEGRRDTLDLQIVGVVADAKYNLVKDTVRPQYFRPYAQDTAIGRLQFYVRTALPSEAILRAVPAVVRQLDPTLPVTGLKTLPQQVAENTFEDRLIGTLSAAFAALATLLAAVGLYGVLAYTVAQRTREIGVRMALGASAARVRALVLGQVGRMLLVGGVAGLLAALAIGRAARSLLFGVEGHDPVAIAMAALVLALVGLAAGYLPARRAGRVEPMRALRYE